MDLTLKRKNSTRITIKTLNEKRSRGGSHTCFKARKNRKRLRLRPVTTRFGRKTSAIKVPKIAKIRHSLRRSKCKSGRVNNLQKRVCVRRGSTVVLRKARKLPNIKRCSVGAGDYENNNGTKLPVQKDLMVIHHNLQKMKTDVKTMKYLRERNCLNTFTLSNNNENDNEEKKKKPLIDNHVFMCVLNGILEKQLLIDEKTRKIRSFFISMMSNSDCNDDYNCSSSYASRERDKKLFNVKKKPKMNDDVTGGFMSSVNEISQVIELQELYVFYIYQSLASFFSSFQSNMYLLKSLNEQSQSMKEIISKFNPKVPINEKKKVANNKPIKLVEKKKKNEFVLQPTLNCFELNIFGKRKRITIPKLSPSTVTRSKTNKILIKTRKKKNIFIKKVKKFEAKRRVSTSALPARKHRMIRNIKKNRIGLLRRGEELQERRKSENDLEEISRCNKNNELCGWIISQDDHDEDNSFNVLLKMK